MTFAVSERPQYIVVLLTGGKMEDMGFVYSSTFKSIKIAVQTAFLKKSEFVLSAYRYCKKLRKNRRKSLYGRLTGHINH